MKDKTRFNVGHALVIALLITLLMAAVLPILGYTLIGGLTGFFFAVGLSVSLWIVFGILLTVGLAYVLYIAWKHLSPPVQLVVILFLFILGIVTLQPEIDVLALIGLVFTVAGVYKGSKGLMKFG